MAFSASVLFLLLDIDKIRLNEYYNAPNGREWATNRKSIKETKNIHFSQTILIWAKFD